MGASAPLQSKDTPYSSFLGTVAKAWVPTEPYRKWPRAKTTSRPRGGSPGPPGVPPKLGFGAGAQGRGNCSPGTRIRPATDQEHSSVAGRRPSGRRHCSAWGGVHGAGGVVVRGWTCDEPACLSAHSSDYTAPHSPVTHLPGHTALGQPLEKPRWTGARQPVSRRIFPVSGRCLEASSSPTA